MKPLHRHSLLRLRPFERHSLVLAVLGIVYGLIGLTYITTEHSPIRQAALELHTSLLPMDAWGVVWIICGGLGVLSSRWPPASETWGYTAMSSLAALWGSMYLAGVLLLDAPALALSGALVWYMVAFLWWAISGLENPERIRD